MASSCNGRIASHGNLPLLEVPKGGMARKAEQGPPNNSVLKASVPPFPFSGLLKVPPFSLWWKPPANCNLRALEDIQRPLQQLQVYRRFPSGNLPLWEVPRRENRLADPSAFLLMTFQKWRSRWTLRFQEVGSRRRLASGLALAGVEPEGQDALRGPRLLQVVDQGRQASASAHVGAGRVGMHLGVGSQK